MSRLSSQIAESAEKVNQFIKEVVDSEAEPKLLYKAATK